MNESIDTKLVLCRIQENGIIRSEDNGRIIGRMVPDENYSDLVDEYPEEDEEEIGV